MHEERKTMSCLLNFTFEVYRYISNKSWLIFKIQGFIFCLESIHSVVHSLLLDLCLGDPKLLLGISGLYRVQGTEESAMCKVSTFTTVLFLSKRSYHFLKNLSPLKDSPSHMTSLWRSLSLPEISWIYKDSELNPQQAGGLEAASVLFYQPGSHTQKIQLCGSAQQISKQKYNYPIKIKGHGPLFWYYVQFTSPAIICQSFYLKMHAAPTGEEALCPGFI